MRLVAGALALTLFASFVRAEGPANPGPAAPSQRVARNKVPLRVVRVMPESHQALLFDRSRATHVLVEVGGKIDGYTVEDIDDDEVTLQFQGKQIVLAAPARGSERRTDRSPAGVRSRSAADARPADTATGDPTPVDPYGEPAIRVVEAPGAAGEHPSPEPASEQPPAGAASAPLEAGEGGIRVAQAPSNSENPSATTPGPREAPGGARPIEPGDNGVRVAEAPGEAASAGPSAGHQPGIRVAQAPRTTRPASARATRPGEAPITDASTTAPNGEPGGRMVEAPGATPGATHGAVTDPAPEAPGVDPPRRGHAPATRQTPAPSQAAIPAHDASPDNAPTAVRAGDPPASKAPLLSDQQTLSARAMADVLTGGSGAHEGRKPTSSLFTARASSPAPAAPTEPSAQAAPAADPRPASAASATVASHADVRSASAGAPASSEAITLSRAEVDAALADFGRLTAAMRGRFSAAGVVVDAVSDGTLFQRAGLRAGDVIAAVDGIRLRSLDDAANVYARASKATAITAQIVRSGKPMTLHVAIR